MTEISIQFVYKGLRCWTTEPTQLLRVCVCSCFLALFAYFVQKCGSNRELEWKYLRSVIRKFSFNQIISQYLQCILKKVAEHKKAQTWSIWNGSRPGTHNEWRNVRISCSTYVGREHKCALNVFLIRTHFRSNLMYFRDTECRAFFSGNTLFPSHPQCVSFSCGTSTLARITLAIQKCILVGHIVRRHVSRNFNLCIACQRVSASAEQLAVPVCFHQD